ncbi:hypothetical protein BaRGS_00032461 [Batillaria attramentaria]|uniref:Uncharacterized protein n=1 Tax=Batillaria attramentaria TaxID=370345 RepID=A0ABD0JNC2_9CAEN
MTRVSSVLPLRFHQLSAPTPISNLCRGEGGGGGSVMRMWDNVFAANHRQVSQQTFPPASLRDRWTIRGAPHGGRNAGQKFQPALGD